MNAHTMDSTDWLLLAIEILWKDAWPVEIYVVSSFASSVCMVYIWCFKNRKGIHFLASLSFGISYFLVHYGSNNGFYKWIGKASNSNQVLWHHLQRVNATLKFCRQSYEGTQFLTCSYSSANRSSWSKQVRCSDTQLVNRSSSISVA